MKKLVLLLIGGLSFHAVHAQSNSPTAVKTEIAEDEDSVHDDEAKPAAVVVRDGFYLSPHFGGGISKVNPDPKSLNILNLSIPLLNR